MSDELDNPFGGFKFLDGGAPTKSPKAEPKGKEKEKEVEIEDPNAVSEAAAKALEEQEKRLAEVARQKAEAKKKAQEAEEEEEEEEEEEPEGKKKETEKKDPPKKEPEVEEEEEEEDDDDNPISAIISHMAENGILDVTEDDKIESEEDLERIQINTINNGIEKYKNSIPEDGKKFLDYLEAGGNAADFHKGYYGDASFEDYTPETEEDQKYIIREGLRVEGYTEDEIAEEIEAIEDSGRVEKKSGIYLKRLQKIEADNKKMLLDSQKKAAKEEEEKRKKEYKEFKDRLFDSEELAGFKLNKKSKTELWSYMTNVDKKTGLTGYQKDMKEDSDVKYIFAYLLKNKWDMSSLEEMVESKKTSDLKSKLGRFTDTRTKLKTGKRTKKPAKKDPTNPFSGFRSIV